MKIKTCANLKCGKTFCEDDPIFITCPECRIYAPNHDKPGGCQHWERIETWGDMITDMRDRAMNKKVQKRRRRYENDG